MLNVIFGFFQSMISDSLEGCHNMNSFNKNLDLFSIFCHLCILNHC